MIWLFLAWLIIASFIAGTISSFDDDEAFLTVFLAPIWLPIKWTIKLSGKALLGFCWLQDKTEMLFARFFWKGVAYFIISLFIAIFINHLFG